MPVQVSGGRWRPYVLDFGLIAQWRFDAFETCCIDSCKDTPNRKHRELSTRYDQLTTWT